MDTGIPPIRGEQSGPVFPDRDSSSLMTWLSGISIGELVITTAGGRGAI